MKLLRRKAAQADVPHLLSMAQAFYDDTRPEWPWDADAFETFLQDCIENQFVSISERGFCVGIVAPYLLSPSWVQAHEVFLWAKDGTGAQHVKEFRAWAKAQGANAIEWSCRSDNERVSKFFSKIATPTLLGFTEVI